MGFIPQALVHALFWVSGRSSRFWLLASEDAPAGNPTGNRKPTSAVGRVTASLILPPSRTCWYLSNTQKRLTHAHASHMRLIKAVKSESLSHLCEW